MKKIVIQENPAKKMVIDEQIPLNLPAGRQVYFRISLLDSGQARMTKISRDFAYSYFPLRKK